MQRARRLMVTALAILVSAALASCATMVRGTREPVQFLSEPPGAQARTSYGVYCVTPCTMYMERKRAFAVTYWKDGYLPFSAVVSPNASAEGAAGFAGNAILGGVVGAGVDLATGAGFDLKPNPSVGTLEKDPRGKTGGPPPPFPGHPRDGNDAPVNAAL